MKQPKPQIRLPDDEGPNPYDSATRFEDLPKPNWMDLGWWVAIIAMGVAFYFTHRT